MNRSTQPTDRRHTWLMAGGVCALAATGWLLLNTDGDTSPAPAPTQAATSAEPAPEPERAIERPEPSHHATPSIATADLQGPQPPSATPTRERVDVLRFRVVDIAGQPVAGATISDRQETLGQTDTRGRWEHATELPKFDLEDPATYVDRFTTRHGSSPGTHTFFRVGARDWWAMIVPADKTVALCTLAERPLADVLVRVVPDGAAPEVITPNPPARPWLLPEPVSLGRRSITGESILPGTRFAPRFRFRPIAQQTTSSLGIAIFTELPKGTPQVVVDHAIHVRSKDIRERFRCDPIGLEHGKVTEIVFTRVLHAIVSGRGDELLELVPMQSAPQRSAVAWTNGLRPSLLRMLDRFQARYPKACVVLQAEDAESIHKPWIHARWRQRRDTEGHDILLRPLAEGLHKITLRPIRPATPKAVGELIVRVLDASGAPFPGEQLEIREGNKPARRWLADEPLWVPPGVHRFAPVAKPLAALGGGYQEIVCPPGRRIEAVYRLPHMVRARFACDGLRPDADHYTVRLIDSASRQFASFRVNPGQTESASKRIRWLPADTIRAEVKPFRLFATVNQKPLWAGFEQTFDFTTTQGNGVQDVRIDWPEDVPAAEPRDKLLERIDLNVFGSPDRDG